MLTTFAKIGLAVLEQLDLDISGEASKFEDFLIDNLNSQNATSSVTSDSDAVEHSVNVISPLIRGSDHSHGCGRTLGRGNNEPNLSNDSHCLNEIIEWLLNHARKGKISSERMYFVMAS